MRKFASKFLLDLLLSVVATVTTAYVTHHYFPGAVPAKAPVAAEPASAGPEGAPERVVASKTPSVVIATVTATTVADRDADTNSGEKAGPPPSPGKYFKPASPAAHRLVPRDKNPLKSNAVVTPRSVQVATVVPDPNRAVPERGGLSPDAPQPGDAWSERAAAAPMPPPEMRKRYLTALVWKPIMRSFDVVAGAFTSHERGRSGE
ncbi:hypothetical protein [Bradyrhizobium erythrophlei]|jgi:hypothetical protein|uniref:Uncharacterized protein n=1 Tax=Bradyrhizobium erythrophlei TaxID=1437360 RepID=A0A1M7UPA4_9BRAD|nr:hypothetical protein [Bradyrhizobium erythrophlei]SHN84784.1 hypothetical protein SAMN05444170_6062 [Bradyrhizobium erythrophlei]